MKTKIIIIDPKNGFRNLPGFRHINLDEIAFDLKAPSNVNQINFIYTFMPILANIASIIYGLEFLNRAVDIAFSQLQQYGKETSLCLKDIYEALLTIKPNSFKERGYYDTSKIGLSFILGKQNLFCCRKGLSLEWLFNQNTVLNVRSLTNELQCKLLLNYLLLWFYEKFKNYPESKSLKHLIIVDDASRFVGIDNQFNAAQKTSPLGHILAVLRSAGVATIFASQLPGQIDPAVLSLSRNVAVIGSVNGEKNLKTIQGLISLTHDQKNAIPRFKTREGFVFISDCDWPYPVHGWTPEVEDLPEHDIEPVDCSAMITPWHSLTQNSSMKEIAIKSESPNFSSAMDKLIWDCINYPFDKVRGRVKRLSLSVRIYEAAMNPAIQEGYLLRSMAGKSVYLIATKKAFEKFNIPCPYERSTSIEHAFYVNLTAHKLRQNKTLKVQTEVPIGTNGATIDTTSIDNEGQMTAFEITLNTSNLLSNGAKLQDTAYERIVWLCKDAATSNAVKAYFNKNISLPKELKEKFEYTHFSNFMKGKS